MRLIGQTQGVRTGSYRPRTGRSGAIFRSRRRIRAFGVRQWGLRPLTTSETLGKWARTPGEDSSGQPNKVNEVEPRARELEVPGTVGTSNKGQISGPPPLCSPRQGQEVQAEARAMMDRADQGGARMIRARLMVERPVAAVRPEVGDPLVAMGRVAAQGRTGQAGQGRTGQADRLVRKATPIRGRTTS